MDIAKDHYVTDEVIVHWRTLGGIVVLADVFCRACHRVGLVLAPPKAYFCPCGVTILIPDSDDIPTNDEYMSQPERPQANVGVIEWINQ